MRGPKAVLICLASLIAFDVHAADFLHIHPLASAQSIIAARGAVNEPAHEIVYRIEGAEPETVKVDLAQDFNAVAREGRIAIYDYALKRILTIDGKSRIFRNTSLYGWIDFRYAESYNRRYERKLLANLKVGGSDSILEPFWAQSELQVMDPEDGIPTIERSQDSSGAINFRFSGATVASYVPSQQRLSQEDQSRFEKFLRENAPLHPTIIKDILASGFFPQRLTFKYSPMTKKPDAVWTLQSVSSAEAIYPLHPADRPAPPDFGTRADSLRSLMPLIEAAVAGTAPRRRTVTAIRAEVEKELHDGKPFAASVTMLELTGQYGQQVTGCSSEDQCHSIKQIFEASKIDPRTTQLIGALGPAKKGYTAAIETLRKMNRDDLSNAYVLDEFLANDLSESDHLDEALPLFANAIRGNPYLAGYYKDLGDVFRERFDPTTAWLFYDLGRALGGGEDAPVISGITDREKDLEKKYPQFF